MKCPSCGADISYGSTDIKVQCGYCMSIYKVPEGSPLIPEPELPPESVFEPVHADEVAEPVQHTGTESTEKPEEEPVYGRSEYRRRLRSWRRTYLVFLLIFCVVYGFGKMREIRLGGEHGSFAVIAATVLFLFSPFAFMQTRPIPPGLVNPLRYKAGRTARTILLLMINFAAMTATGMLVDHLSD